MCHILLQSVGCCILFSCTVKSLILATPNTKSWMFLDSSCSYLCPIHWSQLLSREWRCSWSSADRRCSHYTWVINNLLPTKVRLIEVWRYSVMCWLHFNLSDVPPTVEFGNNIISFRGISALYTCYSSPKIWPIGEQFVSLVTDICPVFAIAQLYVLLQDI